MATLKILIIFNKKIVSSNFSRWLPGFKIFLINQINFFISVWIFLCPPLVRSSPIQHIRVDSCKVKTKHRSKKAECRALYSDALPEERLLQGARNLLRGPRGLLLIDIPPPEDWNPDQTRPDKTGPKQASKEERQAHPTSGSALNLLVVPSLAWVLLSRRKKAARMILLLGQNHRHSSFGLP